MIDRANTDTCRWGILSTATIGRKNWQAIKLSGNGRVVALASRSLDKAQEYIDQCQSSAPFESPPRAVEGYDDLLAADDIDAVYIPLPTGLRKQWVIRAAEAGLHVMCEKPCAVSANELAEMTDACRKNNVQFMDGVMYMHSQRLIKVREALDRENGIGTLKRIAMQFSFCSDADFKEGNIRTSSSLEPQGCLGDLGWYTIRFALWAMRYEMPTSVVARTLTQFSRTDGEKPVPMEIEATLQFANGVSASFYISFITGHQQWAHVSGTEGNVWIPDFVLPFAGTESTFSTTRPVFDVQGCEFVMSENREDFATSEPGNSAENSQETMLFRNFAKIVLSGQIDDHWPMISMKTQRVMDACMESASHDGIVVNLG